MRLLVFLLFKMTSLRGPLACQNGLWVFTVFNVMLLSQVLSCLWAETYKVCRNKLQGIIHSNVLLSNDPEAGAGPALESRQSQDQACSATHAAGSEACCSLCGTCASFQEMTATSSLKFHVLQRCTLKKLVVENLLTRHQTSFPPLAPYS